MADSKQSSPGNEDVNSSTVNQLNVIKSNSRVITGFITRYILNTTTVINEERPKRESFGEKDKSKPHKTILLVGETGTGKSTVINAMVSYMLGVKCNDKIWCEIIETKGNQTDSQTNAVTVHDVFSEASPISLTIIDTPGFGSTKGKEEDLKTAETLQMLCQSEISEINALCLVVSSHAARLTKTQLYIFNVFLTVFGNDVEKNIVVFVTHAPRKPWNTINAIKESKVPCAKKDNGDPVYFRFDNFHYM
ncbi:uncharacterized protein LOC134310070 [Trichomycterus rosablanca]|uniref:uncharacterized protein LOC134310070 n=1 Tax=Trichomycterus rosablanca TaxID=2290929 RepID=UPI002F35FFC8